MTAIQHPTIDEISKFAPHPKKDLTGQRFGRLVVISYAGASKWLCLCDCGNKKSAHRGHLIRGGSYVRGRFQHRLRQHENQGYDCSDAIAAYASMFKYTGSTIYRRAT